MDHEGPLAGLEPFPVRAPASGGLAYETPAGSTTMPPIRPVTGGADVSRESQVSCCPRDSRGRVSSEPEPVLIPGPAPAPSSCERQRSAAACVQILLVEDNPGDARLTREVFAEGRITNNLHVVPDGVEAIRFLRREGPYAAPPGRSSSTSS